MNKRNISGAIYMAVFALALILVGCPSPTTDNKGSAAPTKTSPGLSLNTMERTLTLSFDKNIKSIKNTSKIIVYKKSAGATTDATKIEQGKFTATAVDGKLVITLKDAITAGDIFYVELQALAVTDEHDVDNTDLITSPKVTIPNIFVTDVAIDKTDKTLTLTFNTGLSDKDDNKIEVYKGDTLLEIDSAYTIGTIGSSNDKTLVITLTDVIGASDTFTVKFQAGALTVDDAPSEAFEIEIDTSSPVFANQADALILDVASQTLTVSFNKHIASKTDGNIKVLKTPHDGKETTLEITTDYTIAINGVKVVIALTAWNEGDAYKVKFEADAVQGTNKIGNAEITTEVAIKIETFTITAKDIRVLIGTGVDSSITKNAAITGTFGISPTLPVGLSLDTATGKITGQSAAYVALAKYTVTFTGSGAYEAIRTTTSLTIGIYKYQPKTNAALQENIATEIDAQGATADLNNIDTAAIADMSSIFAENATFNGDISGWNVGKVTTMIGMFGLAAKFNQDISGWNVGNVTDMGYMFNGATSFNQDLGDWNVGNVTDMSQMFYGAAASFNQDLGDWNVGNVTTMGGMFSGATSFNQDISGWNTGNVTTMIGMFRDAASFNQDISGWNVGKVTVMYNMFNGATKFNQDISKWNTGNVTNMGYMFRDATAFNQDISGWNVGKVTIMNWMFNGATAFNQNLLGWNVQSSVDRSKMFAGSGVTTNPSWCSGGGARKSC